MNIQLTQAEIDTFHKDGILVIESGLSQQVIDGISSDLAEMPGKFLEQYQAGRAADAWVRCPNVHAAAADRSIIQRLQQLYGEEARPFQTLNFPWGTEQAPHADSIHFNSEPFGNMCGVWLALEDIGTDQGPLIYYPGSHKLPEINFEDLGLEPSYEKYKQYEDGIAAKIKEHRFTPRFGTIKKGQAIVWAANVLHGGAPQTDKSLSRLSQVTHYYFGNSKYWRPGFSKGDKAYFEPRWIPPVGSPAQGEVMNFARRLKNATRLPRIRSSIEAMVQRIFRSN
nr:phytanoyl-CoA dioxygenase family protein [uncultured Albidiferax sp.]